MKALKYFCVLSFLLVANGALSQSKFTAMTSLDTVYLGNYFELSYALENIKGDIEFPSLDNFDLLSGPNMSSSITMINGETNSQYSYSYRLMPTEPGIYHIDPAICETKEGQLKSEPLTIVVLDNPDGIRQHSQMDIWKNDLLNTPDFFKSKKRKPVEEKPNKKKRKLRRI